MVAKEMTVRSVIKEYPKALKVFKKYDIASSNCG